MKSLFIDREFLYDGSQLRSLYAYLEHRVQGHSIVAWTGACRVTPEHMVDGEDVLAAAEICGDRMVHFIIECFGASLSEMVWMQRLLASIVRDYVAERTSGSREAVIRRIGDDIFVELPGGTGKLSISIATVSPVSGLVHFAVNVTNRGTPVPTASLEELRIPESEFTQEILGRFVEEFASVSLATTKVHWVR